MSVHRPFEYWAFISYSHHDVRVARVLVNVLQKTIVPKECRQNVLGAATTFTPIFLDKQEATAAARLDEALQRALRVSAKLIVLCSPFAVQSRHVADEIRYFQQIGRANDILCLVVSGEPCATVRGQPALECFPAPLSENAAFAPLAAHLGEESPEQWRHAIDQLTAGMLGQALQHRRDWIVKRRKSQQLRLAGAVGLLAGVAYGVTWAFWLPHHVYAKDGMRRWGGWEPVSPISASMASQRPMSLRFSRQGVFGPWTEVRWQKGNGRCTSDGPTIVDEGPRSIVGDAFEFQCTRSQACMVRLNYANGKLLGEVVFDQYEQAIETLTYPRDNMVVLNEAVFGCSRRLGEIESVSLERQPDGSLAGMDRTFRFIGGEDKSPRPNANHAFGLREERDAKGHLILRTLLDSKGLPVIGKEGYASMRWTYNRDGDVIEVRSLGLNGELINSHDGYALTAIEVDELGRWTSKRYFDPQGHPAHDKRGVHNVRAKWDAEGRRLEESYFDAQKRPVSDNRGVAMIRSSYMADRNGERTIFLDEKGSPTWAGDVGCSVVENEFSEDRIERRCFDADRKPVFSKNGVHLSREKYGTGGQLLSEAYYGVDGSTVMCRSKEDDSGCPYHRVEQLFDADGRRVSARFYDLHGNATLNSSGVAGFDLIYNSRGRVKRHLNIGMDGRPARSNPEGIIAIEYEYDVFGRDVERRSVDAEGNWSQTRSNAYGTRSEFDERGNERLTASFDWTRRPAVDEFNRAFIVKKFDGFGRVIEERYFDEKMEPTKSEWGSYGVALEYDNWGRVVLMTRLGPDGKPRPDAEGILSYRRTYDSRGYQTRQEILGADGKLASASDGVAVILSERDVWGNEVSSRKKARDGQLVADRDGVVGVDVIYDSRGNWIRRSHIGVDGRLVKSPANFSETVIARYDERNRLVSEHFLDSNDKPRALDNGVFGYAYRYDKLDRRVEVKCLDGDGNLMARNDGLARWEYDYDGAGGVVETRNFDVSGKAPGSWAPIMRTTNDSYGRPLMLEYFDADRKRILSPATGRARIVYKRDAFGRITIERSEDVAGRLVNRRDVGWAYRTFNYGASGKLNNVLCFDRADNPVEPCPQEN